MTCEYGCHNKLYRDTQNGKVAGVCAGIADYFSWDVTVVRILTVIAGLSFTLLTVCVYACGAIFLQPKPTNLYQTEEEEAYWRQYRKSPRNTMDATKRRFLDLEKKLRKLEAYMTSRKFDLDREFRKMDNS